MRSRELPGAMRRLVDSMLTRSPLQSLAESRTSGKLVVLAYHDVADVEMFRLQAEYLKRRTNVLSLDTFLGVLRRGGDLPERPVMITFDDADRSLYEQALPVLREFDLPALAFVVAGHLGSARPFWWREVDLLVRRGARAQGLPEEPNTAVSALKRVPDRERRRKIRALRRSVPQPSRASHLEREELPALERAGIAIGNHTMTHPVLDRCAPRRVRSEIVRCHAALASALGHEPKAFAFPNGNHDPRSEPVLEELGYECAFVFDHRVSDSPADDPFRISRVRVNSTTSLDRLRILVSGLHPALHHVMGRG